ncbi:MAG: hypothetical protein JXQ71_06975 [Verrucomicrobia bacterium]|nr:hypothetical protein [Verrucomicrobiota bacterium]
MAALVAPPAQEGNRFLFVIETSSAARTLARPGRQAVFDMISTGFYRQMKSGDTYGLWTFSDQPHTGIYPMRQWRPAQAMELASHAAKFLGGRRYRGQAQVAPLMQKVTSVIAAVKEVTVLIVSDSVTQISGTPFDVELQLAYAYWAAQQRKAQQPWITALIAQQGNIVSASVHVAGSPILLLPPPEKKPDPPQPPAPARPTPDPSPAPIAAAPGPKPAPVQPVTEAQRGATPKKPVRRQIIEIRNAKAGSVTTNTPSLPKPPVAAPAAAPAAAPVAAVAGGAAAAAVALGAGPTQHVAAAANPLPQALTNVAPVREAPRIATPAHHASASARVPLAAVDIPVAARERVAWAPQHPTGPPLASGSGPRPALSELKTRTWFLAGVGLLVVTGVVAGVGLRRICQGRARPSCITQSLGQRR